MRRIKTEQLSRTPRARPCYAEVVDVNKENQNRTALAYAEG
jgi:hypothetical protein